jgi:rhamnosyltransferase
MIHIGYPTMGNAWFTNRGLAQRLCDRLGIRVALDAGSPLAPYGGMFIARTRALRPLSNEAWSFDEYPAEGEYSDGTLSHAQERLVSYAAAETGHHTRTIATAEYAAISHTYLEYKLDRMSRGIPGSALDQTHLINTVVGLIDGGPLSVMKYLVIRYFPKLAQGLAPIRRRLRPASPNESRNTP